MRWHDPFNRCLGLGRVPGFRPGPGTKWPLMPRQRQILKLYASGLVTLEVAQTMRISVATVYQHLKRIYKKLGVNTRQEAIEKGLKK